MAAKYKRRDASFKMEVALEAAKDLKQLKQIARDYNIHSKQVSEWRDRLLESAGLVFAVKTKQDGELVRENEQLKKIIGQQALELEWLKKKLGSST